ncbi:MAG: hypothetical protein DHS20C02_19870 [Micavibrio sp.]|nr:MAG: hypothetical protein DHS20C02_19870 [Micavibrio sp.]
MDPSQIIPDFLMHKVTYNVFNVMRAVLVDCEAFKCEGVEDFLRVMAEYEPGITVFSMHPESYLSSAHNPLAVMAQRRGDIKNGTLLEHQCYSIDGVGQKSLEALSQFPALYIGHTRWQGQEPLKQVGPENSFFSKGEEFWRLGFRIGQDLVNSHKTINTITPNPDFL